jgi:hypothetical protein
MVNIIKRIGQYSEFGITLLDDEDGSATNAIEREKRGVEADIVRCIFQLWLRGKGREPVTWTTLVTVLQDIGHTELAKDITEVLK